MKSRKAQSSPHDDSLSVAKGLKFRIDKSGSLRAAVSQSSGEFELSLEIIQLLALIQKQTKTHLLSQRLKSEMRQVAAQLPEQIEIIQLVEDLKQAQCLIGASPGELEGGVQDGFADDWIQWAMLADAPRCTSYERAIKRAVRHDSVVVDLGAGSGLLSLFALQAGARQVTAIEETKISASIKKLKKQLPAGLRERLEIQNCNSFDARIPERTTHVVSELFGNDPFQEGVIPTLRDFFARVQSRNCIAIPRSCEVYFQLVDVIQGPLANRIKRSVSGAATAAQSTWEKAIEQIKLNLNFQGISFAHHMRPSDFQLGTALEKAFSVSLSPPPPPAAKRPKHSCTVQSGSALTAPALLLFFRAQLCEQESVSNIPQAADCCEHWSPIVIPLSRPVVAGEKINCCVSLSDDWCRVTASVESQSRDLLGIRQ